MQSPSWAQTRQALLVRPPKCLEGLEKAIPPCSPYPSAPPAKLSDLQLNKPLPAEPVPQYPPMCSSDGAVWSDDSTFNSSRTQSGSRNSSESYPIFVQSIGGEDSPFILKIVDQPAAGGPFIRSHSPPVVSEPEEEESDSSIALESFLSEERYERPLYWAYTDKLGANHYFREKKFHFFPELATPSSTSPTPTILKTSSSKSRKRDNFWIQTRWQHGSERTGLSHVRDSIRSYVHRTLSRNSGSNSEESRPTTAPLRYLEQEEAAPIHCAAQHRHTASPTSIPFPSNRSFSAGANSSIQNSYDHSDLCREMRSLSISTRSTTSEHQPTTPSVPAITKSVSKQKLSAAPMSAHQKYRAAIWKMPESSKRISYRYGYSVRLPKYDKNKTRWLPRSTGEKDARLCSDGSPSPQQNVDKDSAMANHDGRVASRAVILALDGAKKRLVETKADRRRAQLKKQIKLVGPVNPASYGRMDPWVQTNI